MNWLSSINWLFSVIMYCYSRNLIVGLFVDWRDVNYQNVEPSSIHGIVSQRGIERSKTYNLYASYLQTSRKNKHYFVQNTISSPDFKSHYKLSWLTSGWMIKKINFKLANLIKLDWLDFMNWTFGNHTDIETNIGNDLTTGTNIKTQRYWAGKCLYKEAILQLIRGLIIQRKQ